MKADKAIIDKTKMLIHFYAADSDVSIKTCNVPDRWIDLYKKGDAPYALEGNDVTSICCLTHKLPALGIVTIGGNSVTRHPECSVCMSKECDHGKIKSNGGRLPSSATV